MSDGMLYALVALTIVVLALGVYLAYLARRERAGDQELEAGLVEPSHEKREKRDSVAQA